jgi:hypothetical protein
MLVAVDDPPIRHRDRWPFRRAMARHDPVKADHGVAGKVHDVGGPAMLLDVALAGV